MRQNLTRKHVDQLLRVMNFGVSSDGIGAGENQSFESPFGHVSPERLFAWAGATASWPRRTDPGGSRGLDDCFTRDFAREIGSGLRLWESPDELLDRFHLEAVPSPSGVSPTCSGGGDARREPDHRPGP
jgi:hypothetical protein